jgi:hypothetical protein
VKYFSSFDLLVSELRKSFQQQVDGWRSRVLLASQAEDPGQGSSYWFCMAALGGVSGDLSFALGAGSFVCPSIHKVLGPSLSYPTPLKHPGRWASHSGLFVRGCCVVLHEDSCISTKGHSGGSITPHPVSLMSYSWAQIGSPYMA